MFGPKIDGFLEHSERPRYREGGRVSGLKIDGFSSILSDPYVCHGILFINKSHTGR